MISGTAIPLGFPEIAQVYARFIALAAVSADLRGWLLLYSGLDGDAIAVAIASNVAGTASLGVEPDAARAKQALRAGVCDFVVNNLDEALRILKNEIRKHRAVSVVLTSDLDSAIGEIIARGVQPDVLAFPIQELMERGARIFPEAAERELPPVMWSVGREPARWLPVLDTLAAASLETADARVRWIETAPRYLGRIFATQRFLRMTFAEGERFVAAASTAVETGAIPATVSVKLGNKAISIGP
jgi:hypothetical protein